MILVYIFVTDFSDKRACSAVADELLGVFAQKRDADSDKIFGRSCWYERGREAAVFFILHGKKLVADVQTRKVVVHFFVRLKDSQLSVWVAADKLKKHISFGLSEAFDVLGEFGIFLGLDPRHIRTKLAAPLLNAAQT